MDSKNDKNLAPSMGSDSCGTDHPSTEPSPGPITHQRIKPVSALDDYHVERVTTLEDLKMAFELRHKIYCTRFHAFPENQYGMEWDEYDPFSEHFIAKSNGACIGTLRLVKMLDDVFPMEDHGFHLPGNIPRDTTREVSRIIAMPSLHHHTAIELTKAAHDWSVENGMTHWIYSANKLTLSFMKHNQLIGDSIGSPSVHHGDTYYPFVMPLHEKHRFPW